MRKFYEAHEDEYKRMKSKGIKSWNQRVYPWSICPDDKHFLKDVFTQPWAPKKGQAIELGCGTGAIARWLTTKGFTATGIDISKTAIQMARAQSKGLKINPAPRNKSKVFTKGGVKFINGDICSINTKKLGKYDLCVDGKFLHCITNLKDRKTVLHKALQILKPGGIFVVMSMCSPINRKSFAKLYKGQKVLDNIIYWQTEKYGEFQDSRMINKKIYLPMRFIGHWKKLLSELKEAGFYPMLIRHNHYTTEEPVSDISVAAIRK